MEQKYINISDLFVLKDSGTYSQIFISPPLSLTPRQSVMTLKDIDRRITGSEFDFEELKHKKDDIYGAD